jgi:hypothetical protein
MYPDAITKSLMTLGFTTTDGGFAGPKSLKELNKRYHLLALRHHPDKAGSGGSGGSGDDTTFKDINEAHKRVKEYFYSDLKEYANDSDFTGVGGGGYGTSEPGSYDSFFQLFIKTILVKIGGNSAENSAAIHSIIQSILSKGIQSSVLLFRKMDKSSCIAIYRILSANQELFSISREIMDELTSIVDEKIRDDIVIRLNPSLLDMLLDRVYILNECGQTYYIPLWHSELHFKLPDDNKVAVGDASGANTREIIVLCEPELPDHVTIDENNNIFVSLDISVCDLFRDQVVDVYITDDIKANGFVYHLHACDVTLQKGVRQCVLLRGGSGIAIYKHCQNNTATATAAGINEIYKVTDRANVYALLKLLL